MEFFKDFILVFIETVAFIALSGVFLDKSKGRIIYKSIIVVIITLIFTVTHSINHIFMIILDYFIAVVSLKIAFKKSLKESFIAVFFIISIGLTIEIFLVFAISLLTLRIFNKDTFINSIIFNSLFMIISLYIHKYKYTGLLKAFYRYKEEMYNSHFLIFTLTSYSIYIQYYWDSNEKLFHNNILVLFLIMFIILFFNIKFITYNLMLEEKENTIQLNNMYNPTILNLIEDVRQKQHDFKNHINTIYGITQTAKEENLRESLSNYIMDLNNSLCNVENFIYLNNMTISAILYSKYCEAKSKNINFICDIKTKVIDLPLKDYEISVILTNLIDNAFEEILNFENNRDVCLTIGIIEDKYFIEVQNICRPIDSVDIRKLFHKGYSTKASQGRGYGLYTINQIVQYYNGKIEILFDKNNISFRIIF